MSDDLATLDLHKELQEIDITSSGAWSKSYADRRPGNIRGEALPPKLSEELTLSTPAPAATAIDNWIWYGWKQNLSTAALAYGDAIGRPIPRAEALRIARQIIKEAEQERVQLAEWEAKRGVQWEATG